MTDITDDSFFDDREARRNAFILALCMTLSSCSSIIVFTTGSIIGTMLAPSPGLITAPISAFVIGTATATVPASFLMGWIGRKPGFMIGTGLAFGGAMLAINALYDRNFWLFCAGTMLLGMYQAFTQYYRFAAGDRATERFRSKAISWVLLGGIGGSIFGPLIMINTKELLSPVLFAGSFVASAVLAMLAFLLLSRINIPNYKPVEDERSKRPLKQIMKQPKLIVAIITGMVSYGVMNLVMTTTPVAMVACGFDVDSSAYVIQWHVMAMFIPSFFTGHLIARFGVERIIFVGLFILIMAGVAALSGISFTHFSVALILLGIGWNFGYIGGTTMVTQCYEPSEKSAVQAANDFSVFATVAVSSLVSGQLFSAFGWNAISYLLFPMVGVAIAAMVWLVYFSGKIIKS